MPLLWNHSHPALSAVLSLEATFLLAVKEKGLKRFIARHRHVSVIQEYGNIISYFLGSPVASISGARLVKDMLSKEFITLGPLSQESSITNKQRIAIFGTNNVMFERDKEKHSFLRRLVGSVMSPAALRQAHLTKRQTANDNIDQLLNQSDRIRMEDVCTDYTMEIVRNQLFGLDAMTQRSTSRLSRENDHMAVRNVLTFIQYEAACFHHQMVKTIPGSKVH